MNVGIAGSDQPTGSMFHAHSISDGNKVIYPSLPFVRKIPGIRVETVDQPSTAYQRNIAYDMEAAAVVATARRYVSAEFAHCLKIISDNPDNCLYDRDGSLNRSLINPNSINDLVERNIPGITEFSNTVQHLTTKLPSTISLNDDHEDLLNTLLDNTNTLRMESRPGTDRKPLHVTASQTQQLTALCARHSVLNREIPSKLPDEALANTRSLIVFLENHLSDAYPEYPQHTDDKITSKDAPPTSDV